MNAAEARRRGVNDCYQDHCENCPFGSVGGLDSRSAMKTPEWISDQFDVDLIVEYLDGYRAEARRLYGEDWETCKFSWHKAMEIGGKTEEHSAISPEDVRSQGDTMDEFEPRSPKDLNIDGNCAAEAELPEKHAYWLGAELAARLDRQNEALELIYSQLQSTGKSFKYYIEEQNKALRRIALALERGYPS